MVLLVIDIALAALIAAAVFLRGYWPLEAVAGMVTQFALLALAFSAASLFLAQPLGAAFAFTGALLALWRARDAFATASPRVADPHAKIVWANLFRRGRSFESVQHLALAEMADLVALGEFPEGTKLLPEFAAAFPHQFPLDPTRLRDIVIFSRLPFVSAKNVFSTWRRPSLAVSVMIADEPLTLIATHAPVPWTPKRLDMQGRHIAETFAAAGARAAVIVGDFNAAPWNAVLEKAGAGERLKLGARSTWLAPFPILGIPIDHAFVSKTLTGSAALGPFNGSDHFPVIVSVRRRTPE